MTPPSPSREAISFVTLHNRKVEARGRTRPADIVSHTCGMKIDILEEALLCNMATNEHLSAPLLRRCLFFPSHSATHFLFHLRRPTPVHISAFEIFEN